MKMKFVYLSLLVSAVIAAGACEASAATVVNQWTDIRSRACTNPHEYGCVNSDWYHGGGYYLIDPSDRSAVDPSDRSHNAPRRKHRHHS